MKRYNILLVINVVSILLLIAVFLLPSNSLRIILGIPFLTFFPGYSLLAAIFPYQKKIDFLEVITLSIGMSIAVTSLLWIALNYTGWGINTLSQLVTLEGFIIVMSVITFFRKPKYEKQWKPLRLIDILSKFQVKSKVDTFFAVIVCLSIVSFLGILGFTAASPKNGEKYTEFYILGSDGQAKKYPVEFVLDNDDIDRIIYSDGTVESQSIKDTVILGVVNHEQKTLDYNLTILVNNEPVRIIYDNDIAESISGLTLKNEEKWEQKVGFIPTDIGDNQKVEFLLTAANGETRNVNSLHFWINVRQEEE